MKKLLCYVYLSILLLFLSFFSFTPPARAAGDVFIISQVRGSEDCCQPGSLDHLQYQLDQLNQHNFAGSFLFRYDALTNPDLVAAFLAAQKSNPNLSAGLWLEITPSLAIDSGVVYRGNQKNWPKAEHSLLVGYSQKERQKLLHTVINQFHLSFPDEPLFVAGAWGIDTPSLNYLESVGVKIFQSVREQWGIDGFFVDGSAINRPYFPSSSWYLTPSASPRDLIVIKHTISDPLHAYGNSNSIFTSQPNDFNKLDLTVANYFAPLLSQSLHLNTTLVPTSTATPSASPLSSSSSPRGWATIGLETSMEEQYQLQFGAQLDLLADLTAQGQASVLTIDNTVQRFITNQEAAAITLSPARDLLDSTHPLRAFWVETPSYRLRFRLTDQGVILDDVRSYNDALIDRYNDYQAQNGFFGIIPPVFSTQFTPFFREKTKTWAVYTVAPDDNPAVGQVFPAAAPDTLRFHHPTISFSPSSSSASVSYLSVDNQEVTLTFTSDHWQSNVEASVLDSGDWPWQHDDYLSQQLVATLSATSTITPVPYIYSYSTNPDQLSAARNNYRRLLFPEVAPGEPAVSQSFFDWINPYTPVSILPSRLVLFPLDESNYPVIPANLSITTEPPIDFSVSDIIANEYLFIDFHSAQAQKVKIKTYFGTHLANEQTLYFVTDCRHNLRQCGLNPVSWWRYLRWKIQNRLNSF